MKLLFYLNDAGRGLLTAPLRSLLSILTMMVGVASLCLVVNLKSMVQEEITKTLDTIGPRALMLWLHPDEQGAKHLSLGQVPVLQSLLPNSEVLPFEMLSMQVRLPEESLEGRVMAVSDSLIVKHHWRLASGQTWQQHPQPFAAVVGASFAQKYHLQVGDDLWLDNQRYRLQGILEPVSVSLFDSDINQSVLVRLHDVFHPLHPIEHLVIQYDDLISNDDMKATLKRILSSMYSIRHVYFRDESLFTVEYSRQMERFQVVFSWVALLAFALSSVGIAGQQWMGFLERRGECGMRLSIGATRLDLFSLFLCEALILGTLGAFLGGLLGIIGVYYCANMLTWHFHVTFLATIGVLGAGVALAAVAGMIPAWIASQSHPTKLLAYQS